VGKGQGKAQSVQCLSNLRDWGHATLLYKEKFGGALPKDGSPNGTSKVEGWYVELPPFIGLEPYHQQSWRTNAGEALPGNPWICPSNPRVSNGNNLFHYSLNRGVNGSGAGNRRHTSTITYPAMTVWMFDNGGRAAVARQNNVHPELHSEGANFLFLDGHAENVPSEEYWDFSSDRGHTNSAILVWDP